MWLQRMGQLLKNRRLFRLKPVILESRCHPSIVGGLMSPCAGMLAFLQRRHDLSIRNSLLVVSDPPRKGSLGSKAAAPVPYWVKEFPIQVQVS